MVPRVYADKEETRSERGNEEYSEQVVNLYIDTDGKKIHICTLT